MALLIFELSDIILAVIKDIKGEFSDDALDWVNAFKYIAAAGAFIFITKRYLSDQSAGKPLDVNNYLKPFVIALVLMFYLNIMSIIDVFFNSAEKKTNTLWVGVASTLNNPAVQSIIGTVTTSLFGGGKKGVPNSAAQATDAEIQTLKELIATSGSATSFNTEIMKGQESEQVKEAENKLSAIDFIKLAANSVAPIMKILGQILLTILFVTGPIAIGMSLMPTFEKSLGSWVSLYVKISLWPVISNIISFVILRISADPRIIASTFVMGEINKIGQFGDGIGPSVYYGAMLAAQASVPTIASALVAASGFDSLAFTMMNNRMGKVLKALE
jgi:hypothetical protein